MIKIVILFLAMTATANASAGRNVVGDDFYSSSLSLHFTLPSSSDQFAGSTVSNHGTGATSFTTNGMLYGNGTSAIGVTAAGSQYAPFQAGAAGVPTVGALHLDQASAVTNALGVPNGGTNLATLTAHCVLVGAGTASVHLVCPSSAGQVLTDNGGSSDPSFSAASSPAPALNGGSGSVESITAAGGITLSSLKYVNFVWVIGSPGAVTVTATPSITACTADGQLLYVVGTDNTKTVRLQDQSNLASSGLSLNGDVILAKDSVIALHCDITQGLWIEDNRR